MLVKPKPYSKSNKYGGYLNNGLSETNDLIIHKNLYRNSTTVNKDINFVYRSINSISSCPFTINTKVLDFLMNRGEELNFK